jgi:hypothetical protein
MSGGLATFLVLRKSNVFNVYPQEIAMNSKFHNCSRLSIVVVTIATTTAIASSLKPAIAYPTSQPEATSLPITLNPSGLSYTMQLQTDDIPVSEPSSMASPPTSAAHSPQDQLAMKTDPSQPTNSEPAQATR